MFNKRTEEEQPVLGRIEPAAPAQPEAKKRKVSVIGPTLKFNGELSANEDLIIEGEIQGTIAHQDKNLTVGPQGRVAANINAKTIEIHGRVDGDIRGSDLVKLARTAKVDGNISCGRIVMDDGATFTGNIEMSGQPTSKPQKLGIADKMTKADSNG